MLSGDGLRLGLGLNPAPSRAPVGRLGNTLRQQRGWWLQNLTASVAGLMACKEANTMPLGVYAVCRAQLAWQAPHLQLGSCICQVATRRAVVLLSCNDSQQLSHVYLHLLAADARQRPHFPVILCFPITTMGPASLQSWSLAAIIHGLYLTPCILARNDESSDHTQLNFNTEPSDCRHDRG